MSVEKNPAFYDQIIPRLNKYEKTTDDNEEKNIPIQTLKHQIIKQQNQSYQKN